MVELVAVSLYSKAHFATIQPRKEVVFIVLESSKSMCASLYSTVPCEVRVCVTMVQIVLQQS